MAKSLFAFRIAKPLEVRESVEVGPLYDPETQTAVWQGNSRAQASGTCKYHCNNYPNGCYFGACWCNAYGTYCNLQGSGCFPGVICD